MEDEAGDKDIINNQLSFLIDSSFSLLENEAVASSSDIIATKAKKFIESSIAFYNKINSSSKSDKEKIDSLQKYLDYMRKFLSIIEQKEALKEFQDPIESLVKKIKETILSLKVSLIKRLNESKEEKEGFISSLITTVKKYNFNTYLDYGKKKGVLIEMWDKAKKTTMKCVLLFGPKGNGEKVLAKCLSTEVNSYFLNLNFPDLFNHIENLPVVLDKVALTYQPIIIFIPDVEDFNKQKDKLIFFITKLLENKMNQVLIIASSSNPWSIEHEIEKYFSNKEYIGPVSKKNKPLYVKSLLKGVKYNITEEQFTSMADLLLKYSNHEIKMLIQSIIVKMNKDGVIEYQQIIDSMVSYNGSITAEVLLKFKNYK